MQIARPRNVLRFRLRATHLDERLPSGKLSAAAYGGLQDTAPRAAQISLHARVEGATPSAWEHPSLVQIWFRGADYVVPRADLAAFTLGCLPRDPDQRASLEAIADDVVRALDGQRMLARDLYAALPQYDRGMVVRFAAPTGRYLIRWDASKIWIVPVDRPDADVEQSRLELARRFVRWFGPCTPERFAWWAGIGPDDANETWRKMTSDVIPVKVGSEERFIFASDEPRLRDPSPITGVRLVPPDDPVLKLDRSMITEGSALGELLFPARSPGYIPGGLFVDGELAGVWQRQRHRVTVHVPAGVDGERIEAEALSLRIPGRSAPGISFRLETVG